MFEEVTFRAESSKKKKQSEKMYYISGNRNFNLNISGNGTF